MIVLGPGHTGPDGLSIMPDFRDSLTLAETIDLVAFIRSLGGGDHAHHGARTARPRADGRQLPRCGWRSTPPGQGGDHAQHDHARGQAHARRPGTSSSRHRSGHRRAGALPADQRHDSRRQRRPRTVNLVPMMGGQGFHYGADVTLAAATTKITVAIAADAARDVVGE